MTRVPPGLNFEPLMVLYLTDNTDRQTLREAQKAGVVACKLYPSGATTNSDAGVTSVSKIDDALAEMEDLGMLLLVHGEVTDSHVDIFDREATFIDQVLSTIIERFPGLKVVLEHITTRQAVEFVSAANSNVAATITAHHLLFNRNDMLVGGIRPHYYCLPILKRMEHQRALVEAATSGNSKFFLGTDSAPHVQNKKEASCGCAGCYTAYAALPMYAEVFEQANALDRLESFASHHGPDFYGLPRNTHTITLERKAWQQPDAFPMGTDTLIPLMGGETFNWQLRFE